MQILNTVKETEYHLITCDHPFFVDAGMGSFTLPQLIEWWNKRDYRGVYTNQVLFKPGSDVRSLSRYLDIDTIMGYRYNPYDDTFSYVVNCWRFDEYNKGTYQSYMLFGIIPEAYGDTKVWEYFNNNPEARVEEAGSFSLDTVN